MTDVFGKFGQYYDLIYQDKDYARECDFVEQLLREHAPGKLRRILELGCGTGRHTITLADRGYAVTGIDLSPTVVDLARRRAHALGTEFLVMDMRALQFPERFDACICLFCGICYLTDDEDLRRTFGGVRASLRTGGLFVFDFWNGMAVAAQGPTVRVKEARDGEARRILRIAEPDVRWPDHVCRLRYHCLVVEDGTLVDEFEEVHALRFFFPREMSHYLQESGFEVVQLRPFMGTGLAVSPEEWYLTAVARAR